MPAEYDFELTDLRLLTGPITPKDDDDDQEGECYSLNAQQIDCEKSGIGSVTFTMRATDPECLMVEPYLISLYQFGFDGEDILLDSYSGVNNSGKRYDLDRGEYYFHVSGQLNSQLEAPFTIEYKPLKVENFRFEQIEDELYCAGIGSGYISWKSGQYNYSIANTNYNGVATTGFYISGLPISKNPYQIVLSNENCQRSFYFYMGGKSLSTKFEKTGVSCAGQTEDGIALAIPSGGTPPYYYYWYGEDLDSIVSLSRYASGLGTGRYYCLVKDASGCTNEKYGVIPSVSIGYNSDLNVSIQYITQPVQEICCQEEGSIYADLAAIVNGGVPPYTYLWSDGKTGPVANYMSVGRHYVTVIDGNGCTGKSNEIEIKRVLNCFKVKWDFGDGNHQEFILTPSGVGSYDKVTHTYNRNGEYLVSVSVVDGNGNKGIKCKKITMTDCPPLKHLSLGVSSNCVVEDGSTNKIFTVIAYDEYYRRMEGVKIKAHIKYLDVDAPPYSGTMPSEFTCSSSSLNAERVVDIDGYTDSNGLLEFAMEMGNCEFAYVKALPEDNFPEAVLSGVESNNIGFYVCSLSTPGGFYPPPPFIPPDEDDPEDPNPGPGGDQGGNVAGGGPSQGGTTGDLPPGLPPVAAPYCVNGICIDGNSEGTITHEDGRQEFVPATYPSFFRLGLGTTCSNLYAEGRVTLDTDTGLFLCGPPKQGACCVKSEDRCFITTHEICNNKGGTFYQDNNCSDVELLCFPRKDCCVGFESDSQCFANQLEKDCLARGGKWGVPCSECVGEKGCCAASDGCPGEDGCTCGQGCCCCPGDEACGIVNGKWQCVSVPCPDFDF